MSATLTIDCSQPASTAPAQPAAPMTRAVITARGVVIPAHAKPTKKNGK